MTDAADPDPSDDVLDWTESGPRSRRFGDVYYSLQDGLAESRAVFLDGCGLPDAWAGRTRFVVGELGFGTGLNIVALLDLWRRARPAGGRLHVFTIEAHPLAREDATRALAAWPDLAPVAGPLLDAWPPASAGFHRVDLPAFGAVIDLAVGDAEWALAQWTGRADAWFLDGFSPALNPTMWSDGVLEGVTARSAPDARLATFTVAGAVRRGLAERGWRVDKRPGHGRKRERLEARRTGQAAVEAAPSVAVIGGGIAGASVCRALGALGVAPVLIEAKGLGAGSSGFPAALVTPRFDLGDPVIAALGAQSLLRATALYDATPGAVIAPGVIRLEGAARDVDRFDRLADQAIWPPGALVRLTAEQATARLGRSVEAGGLDMTAARTVDPAAILAAWAPPDRIAATVTALAQDGSGWALLDADGLRILSADVVVVAGGWDGGTLTPDLPLAPVQGQAVWADDATAPAVAWGGYVAPTRDGMLAGATHDRDRTDRETSAAATGKILEGVERRLPGLTQRVDIERWRARAAVRATTPDRLPICGAAPDRPDLYVLTGLGSRGFAFAPLLAEHLAAIMLSAPSPLPRSLASRIDPGRGLG